MLLVRQQYRAVLQQRVAASELRAADDLAALDQDLPTRWETKAGTRPERRGRTTRGQSSSDAQRAQCVAQQLMDLLIGCAQRAKVVSGTGHRIRQLVGVENGAASGGPSYRV